VPDAEGGVERPHQFGLELPPLVGGDDIRNPEASDPVRH